VGGVVAGLSGTVVLQLNGAQDLTVSSNGPFSFPNALTRGTPYAVTVRSPPAGQTCDIFSGLGTVAGTVTDVRVDCTTNSFAVSGNVAGMTGTVVLQLNGTQNLSLTANGTFLFATQLPYGTPYSVTVLAQPTGQLCSVSAGTGTIVAAVSNVQVDCTTLPVSTKTVGGSASGIVGTGLTISLNGSSTLPLDADGNFTFLAGVPQGTSYLVTIIQQPSNPAQACLISGGSGIATADVTSVRITCPPVAPGLAVLSGSARSKQLSLTWTAARGANTYQLQQQIGSGGWTNATGVLGAAQRSAVIDVSVHTFDWANTRYRVQACNTVGCTPSGEFAVLSLMLDAILYAKSSNTQNGAGFGATVALSADGTRLAVGAPGEQSVYVFVRASAGWTLEAVVSASNAPNALGFASGGPSMALSADGSALVVGAWAERSGATGINGNQTDISAPESGAAYIFSRSGSAWTQTAYVKASNTSSGAFFGARVAISGDGTTVAIGAEYESSGSVGVGGDQSNTSASGAGAVYVFGRNAGAWTQTAYVKASNTRAGGIFGSGVSLSFDGNVMAVGSAGESSAATGIEGNQSDTSATNAGAAYVFVRAAGTWSQQAYVKASNTRAEAYFGAVALSSDGSTLAVGSNGESSGATGIDGNQANTSAGGSGAVYVYAKSGGSWFQEAYVKASNTRTIALFGLSVAIASDGNVIAVGSYGESSAAKGVNGNQADTSAANSGAVYVFRRTATVWSQQSYVKAPNTRAEAIFGWSVALSADGSTMAIGSSGEASSASGLNGDESGTSAPNSGAAYLY
jgi:hypothetical protein